MLYDVADGGGGGEIGRNRPRLTCFAECHHGDSGMFHHLLIPRGEALKSQRHVNGNVSGRVGEWECG